MGLWVRLSMSIWRAQIYNSHGRRWWISRIEAPVDATLDMHISYRKEGQCPLDNNKENYKVFWRHQYAQIATTYGVGEGWHCNFWRQLARCGTWFCDQPRAVVRYAGKGSSRGGQARVAASNKYCGSPDEGLFKGVVGESLKVDALWLVYLGCMLSSVITADFFGNPSVC